VIACVSCGCLLGSLDESGVRRTLAREIECRRCHVFVRICSLCIGRVAPPPHQHRVYPPIPYESNLTGAPRITRGASVSSAGMVGHTPGARKPA